MRRLGGSCGDLLSELRFLVAGTRAASSARVPPSALPARFLFPRWVNHLPRFVALALALVLLCVIGVFWYWGSDKFWRVGYQPAQPVEFSHKLHAGDLGIDCRYCHSTVERASFAAVPPTQVCMNCHRAVKPDSPRLAALRDRVADDRPIPWIRVHTLPDYVYFDHGAHLAAGVGCSSCHGRVDQMTRVTQVEPLTMGWCLDCHRDPGRQLRGTAEVTQMDWKPAADQPIRLLAATGREVHPPVHCSGCHR